MALARAGSEAALLEGGPKDARERSARDYQPNTMLVTQDGKSVRFYDDLVKGRVVLINMMFTTCRSICPSMTANLRKVQKLLKERLGPRADEVRMLSISVDPETDTPQALKEYAARFGIEPGWYFLTGKKEDVDAILAKLGNGDPDKDRHSGMLIVGNDATRSFKKVFAMSPPEDIVALVKELMGKSPKKP